MGTLTDWLIWTKSERCMQAAMHFTLIVQIRKSVRMQGRQGCDEAQQGYPTRNRALFNVQCGYGSKNAGKTGIRVTRHSKDIPPETERSVPPNALKLSTDSLQQSGICGLVC